MEQYPKKGLTKGEPQRSLFRGLQLHRDMLVIKWVQYATTHPRETCLRRWEAVTQEDINSKDSGQECVRQTR